MADEAKGGLSGPAQAALIAGFFGLMTAVLTNWDKMPWNRPAVTIEKTPDAPSPAPTPPVEAPTEKRPTQTPKTKTGPSAPPANPAWTGYADSPDSLTAPARLRLYARAVGRAEVDGQPRCTAFLVAERLALTASYCVPDDVGSLVVQFDTATPPVPARLVESTGMLGMSGASDVDHLTYAILMLDGAPGAERGWLPLSSQPVQSNEPVRIIGGALERSISPQCLVIRADSNVFEHDCDPGEGGGGAPVLNSDGSRVVGMHAFGLPPDRKRKVAVRMDVLSARSARLARLVSIE